MLLQYYACLFIFALVAGQDSRLNHTELYKQLYNICTSYLLFFRGEYPTTVHLCLF